MAFGWVGVTACVANEVAYNDIVAGECSNMVVGTGWLNETNDVKVLDMADLDGSQNVRVIMRFTSGVQYGFGTEVVLYDPTV